LYIIATLWAYESRHNGISDTLACRDGRQWEKHYATMFFFFLKNLSAPAIDTLPVIIGSRK